MRGGTRSVLILLVALLCVGAFLVETCVADTVILKVFEDVNGSSQKRSTEKYLSGWTFKVREYSGTAEAVVGFIQDSWEWIVNKLDDVVDLVLDELRSLVDEVAEAGSWATFMQSDVPSKVLEITTDVADVLIDAFDYSCLALSRATVDAIKGDFRAVLQDHLAPYITQNVATYADLAQAIDAFGVSGTIGDLAATGNPELDQWLEVHAGVSLEIALDSYGDDMLHGLVGSDPWLGSSGPSSGPVQEAIGAGLNHVEAQYGVDLIAEQGKPTTAGEIKEYTTDSAGEVVLETPWYTLGDLNYYIDLEMKAGWTCTRSAGQVLDYDNQSGNPTNTYSFGVRRAVIREVLFRIENPDGGYFERTDAYVGDTVRVSFDIGPDDDIMDNDPLAIATIFGKGVDVEDRGSAGRWIQARHTITATDRPGRIPFGVEFTDDDGFTGAASNASDGTTLTFVSAELEEILLRVVDGNTGSYKTGSDANLACLGDAIRVSYEFTGDQLESGEDVEIRILGQLVTPFDGGGSSYWWHGDYPVTEESPGGLVTFSLGFTDPSGIPG
ncbi:hypothetical protein ACFLTM_04890, partial [Candidatus Bipolaricaulota bacterium]